MKLKRLVKKRLNMTLTVLFVFMLLSYTVLPNAGVRAAEQIRVESQIEINGTNALMTEEKIQSSDGITIKLTLDDSHTWASDIYSKKQLIIDSMNSVTDKTAWDTYKATNISIGDVTGKTLTLVLKKDAGYKISKDQTITMNLSPALIENWEGIVVPVSFTIYAQPALSIGGSIVSNITAEKLAKGGITLDLNLVNAEWKQDQIKLLNGLNRILDLFKNDTAEKNLWDVAKFLKTKDPNSFVSFVNNNKTLRFKLPSIPQDQIKQTKIFFSKDVSDQQTLKQFIQLDVNSGGSNLDLSDNFSFSIDTTGLLIEPSTSEASILAGGSTIKLTLSGNTLWNLNSLDKKKVLIDALTAADDQSEQWDKVKAVLKGDLSKISVDDSNKILTIVIPKVTDYYLTKDQSISLTVPYQLLSNSISIGKQTFTIKATPKVLLSGTVAPAVSQTDIIKGGKTIVLSLVNTTWDTDVAANTAKREALLDSFTWGQNSALKASAQVDLTNDHTVTIKMPSLDTYKISSDEKVTFKPDPIKNYTGAKDNLATDTTHSFFTINPVKNQTAIVSGLTFANEFDIAAGGKTMTITLKNDTWVKDVENQGAKFTFTAKDEQGNNVILPGVQSIKRNSDAVITLALNADSSFNLLKDASVNLTVPADAVTASKTAIEVSSAFKINAVTANLSGTGLSLSTEDIQKGGKTISVKLNNATFKNYSDPSFFTDFIRGFTTGSDSQWLTGALTSNLNKIKATKDTVTITLPAIPSYTSAAGDVISLNIPKNLITNATQSIAADKTITVGQIATAKIGSGLSESAIQSGAAISITLTGAAWDQDLSKNKSKLSTLLKGFTAADQTKEWADVINAIQSASLTDGNRTIILKISPLANFSLIRELAIDVTIPKAVLEGYNYDIEAGKLNVAIPEITPEKSLSELLNDDLTGYIEDNGLNNIRVIVPEKKVRTISVNTVDVPGSGDTKKSITTIEVTAADDVEKVNVAIKGQNGGEITKEQTGSGKFTFILANLETNSDLTISVYGTDDSVPLQENIYKKITSGVKTYSEEPKTPISGSYPLYRLLKDNSLVSNILKYYSTTDLKVGF